MQLGMVGLGRMGANMVRRLLKGGLQCVVFDVSPNAVSGHGPPGFEALNVRCAECDVFN
jgi:6-phosphogluconate dehydrogenase (decarboxylating)